MNDAASDFSIRPTRKSDAPALRDLRLEALRLHPEAFGADYAASLAWSEAEWEARAERGAGNKSEMLVVAEAESALIGMTGLFCGDSPKTRHAGVIWGVYVQKAWRGRGVADALLGAATDWACTHKLRLVKLSVVTPNAPAIGCYVRAGFTVYGLEPEAIYCGGLYYDELLMVRRLEQR